VKSGRVKCLRCGEPLVARQDVPAPERRPIPWKIVGLVTGCVTLGGLATIVTGGFAQPSPSTTSTAVDPSRVLDAPARSASASAGVGGPDPASIATSDLIAGQQAYVSGNIDTSLEQLQAAVEANPNDPRALSDLGQLLVRTGRAREAVAYLDKAVSLKPDSWAYQFNRARAYAQLQEWGQAVEGYRAAARLFPDDYATQYNLAKALQASGDIDAALAAYEKAIELAPGQSDFQLSYGLALETAKRPKDAAAAYRRYLELEPDSPQTEKVKAHLAALEHI
jgi:tetratricopeptide (TPR) repeat protein